MGIRDPPGRETKERALFLIVIPFVTHICDLTFNRKVRPPPIAISSFLRCGSVGFFRSSSLGLTIELNHDPFRQCGRTSM